MRPRRGDITHIVSGTVSGTRLPNPTSNTPDDDTRPHGGVSGAHENRREYGAETLQARCWCQRQTVDVPAEVIRRTETLTCGQPDCTKDTYL